MPILAAGLILSAPVQGEAARHDTGRSASAQQNQTKPQSDTAPALPVAVQRDIERIASALEAANNKAATPEEQRQAAQNLRDQDWMANWAGAMFFIGLVEMIITGLGVWLVAKTLLYTRDTLAQEQEANRIAQEIFSLEQRAWVSIENVEIAEFRIGKANRSGIFPIHAMIKFTISNTGKVPATNIISHAVMCDAASDDDDLLAHIARMKERSRKGTSGRGQVLAPSQRHSVEKYAITRMSVPTGDDRNHIRIGLAIATDYVALPGSQTKSTYEQFVLATKLGGKTMGPIRTDHPHLGGVIVAVPTGESTMT